jgi:hypothetical protein
MSLFRSEPRENSKLAWVDAETLREAREAEPQPKPTREYRPDRRRSPRKPFKGKVTITAAGTVTEFKNADQWRKVKRSA